MLLVLLLQKETSPTDTTPALEIFRKLMFIAHLIVFAWKDLIFLFMSFSQDRLQNKRAT